MARLHGQGNVEEANAKIAKYNGDLVEAYRQTKDRAVLRDPDNSRGIYWSNLWYFRDIVANAIVSYQSDVSPGRSFVWTTAPGAREICENHELKHLRPRLAWVHSDYLQDPLFWDKVGWIVA